MAGEGTPVIAAQLDHWALGVIREVSEIHPGRVWRVACADGRAFILKDIGAGPDVERRFAFECDVLRHLDRSGIGVAIPVPDRRGVALVEHGGRLYTLSPCLATNNRWLELDLEGLLRLNHNCGAAIARLHAALATYPAHDLAQRTWRTALPDQWFERSIPTIRQGLAAREGGTFDRAAFDRAIQVVEGELRRAASGLPEQLIHRDCHHGNIVVHGERVSGFVDCDHLSLGPRVLDWPISWCTWSRGTWPTGRPRKGGSCSTPPSWRAMSARTPSQSGNGGPCTPRCWASCSCLPPGSMRPGRHSTCRAS